MECAANPRWIVLGNVLEDILLKSAADVVSIVSKNTAWDIRLKPSRRGNGREKFVEE